MYNISFRPTINLDISSGAELDSSFKKANNKKFLL